MGKFVNYLSFVKVICLNFKMAAAKPNLRNLLVSQTKAHFALTCGAVFLAGLAFVKLYQEPKKRRHEHFFKTTDPEAEYIRQRNVGIFHSVNPDGSLGSGKDGWCINILG